MSTSSSRTMAPMGQAGLKMFQAFMEGSAANMGRTKSGGETKSDD